MEKKMTGPGMLLTASAIALATIAPSTFAQTQVQPGSAYLSTSRGDAVMGSSSGVCVRTSYWSPAMATPQCDPDLIPKPSLASVGPSTPPPAPRAAAPAPAPAPAAPLAAAPPKPVPVAPKPVVEKVTLQSDALFDFDKARLRSDAQTKMDDLVSKARNLNPEVIIAVGHTDRLGSVAYNEKLSVRRAEAVKEYLISKGVPANRIYTEGKGKSQPVKECTEKSRQALIACLQPNRRVEVEVVGTVEH